MQYDCAFHKSRVHMCFTNFTNFFIPDCLWSILGDSWKVQQRPKLMKVKLGRGLPRTTSRRQSMMQRWRFKRWRGLFYSIQVFTYMFPLWSIKASYEFYYIWISQCNIKKACEIGLDLSLNLSQKKKICKLCTGTYLWNATALIESSS